MGVGAASGFSGRPERVGCRHRLIFNARGLGIIRQESSVSLVLRDWNMFVRQFKASILAYDFVSGNCLRFQIGPEKRRLDRTSFGVSRYPESRTLADLPVPITRSCL